ncbi:MAG: hypothetical protein HGA67_04270 [Candidatus Yonathbacteria bacterium]|nr:hypothetical protein [Candidatus Yonathbacteria bacterium]
MKKIDYAAVAASCVIAILVAIASEGVAAGIFSGVVSYGLIVAVESAEKKYGRYHKND